MSERKVEAGQKWIGNVPISPLTIHIKYVGDKWAVVESKSGGESTLTVNNILVAYKKVEPFFQVGKTYQDGRYEFHCLAVWEYAGEKRASGWEKLPGDSDANGWAGHYGAMESNTGRTFEEV